jgi:indolepyruvate decarboxylase
VPTLAAALLRGLKDYGAREIFGIPGDFVLPFFRVIEESGILPFYTLSHEPAVGFAADASARFHGALGVAVVTYGAGAFNIANAVAGSYAERVPLVVISGSPGVRERQSGYLLHHQARTVDTQLAVFRELTCAQAVLDEPARAPDEIARVLSTALERSLPVYIELRRDLTNAACDAAPVLPRREPAPHALAACVDDVMTRLTEAKRPVIVVDVEVRRYGIEAQVVALARGLGIPVVTTLTGRGLLADAPDVMLGTYLGSAGDPALQRLVEDSDAVLLMGVILCDTNIALWEGNIDMRRSMYANAGQVRIGHHVYPDMPIRAVAAALAERARKGKPRKLRKSLSNSAYPRDLPHDDAPIEPTDIARAVNDMFAKHGPMPMASDMGDCLFVAMEIDQTPICAPGYYAGMGYGVPAGLGVAAAMGERPLIVVGDGAFQMTGWELGNCRRYGWAPIVVVFNNASWEMLRVFQPESKFNDLDDWRFAEMAEPMGGVGERVTTRAELADALERARARTDRFSLIEVMLPRGVTSDTLARFVAGFQKARERAKS